MTLIVLVWGGVPFIFLILATLAISLREWQRMAVRMDRPLLSMLAGSVYLVCCLLSFVLLRLNFAQGAWLSLCLLIAVWASDSGAYFTGKTFGGPKLAPKTSPKKTWAGLMGAMVFCGLSLVLLIILTPHIPDLDTDMGLSLRGQGAEVFAVGCLLGLVGQVGDLLISKFKRQVGVKDTGHLIPGHGGMLDRIDAALLVSPVFLTLAWAWLS